MSGFTFTKKPTKRDYVVELAKLYNIKINSKSVIELMVQTLNTALKDKTQVDRVVDATLRGHGCYKNTSIIKEDWDNIESTINKIKKKKEMPQESDDDIEEVTMDIMEIDRYKTLLLAEYYKSGKYVVIFGDDEFQDFDRLSEAKAYFKLAKQSKWINNFISQN